MNMILIPVVSGIIEFIKLQEWFPKQLLPFVAVLIGGLLSVGLGFIYETGGVHEDAISGMLIGLSSVGLYEGIKGTAGLVKEKRDSL